MSVRTPKYRHHKGSGQALVCIEGRRYYLGPFGSPESKQRYKRMVTDWLAGGTTKPPEPRKPAAAPDSVLLAEVCAAYKVFAEGYYRKDGELSGSIYGIYVMLDLLAGDVGLFGDLPAAAFDSTKFDTLIRHMVGKGWSRTYVNDHIGRVKQLVKWAARQKLVPVATWHEVQLVAGLQKGRTTAYEPAPVEPVAEDVVEATLPHLSSVLQDMIRLQRATGARPGEICVLRPCDLDRSGDVWTFKPHRHKLQHKGLDRTVYIGPAGQAVLLKYLLREPTAYCFSPRESLAESWANRREARHSRVQPSQQCRTKARPKRAAGDRYETGSYATAVKRAARKACVEPWSPNQLRHLAATKIRAEFGLEAAASILGHTRVSTTEIYAQANKQRAVEVVRLRG